MKNLNLMVVLLLAGPGGMAAQGTSAKSVGVSVRTATGDQKTPSAGLPGVGYVVLNEQIATVGGITVNMIHVVLQQQVLFGYQTTGDIIVGSASSSVN